MQSPFAREECSPLGGRPAFVVELDASERVVVPDGALRVLAELPSPTVAIARGRLSGEHAAFAGRCDVVVDSDQAAEAVVAGIAASPTAALALVQLLRLGEGLGVHDALVAESLTYSTLQGGPEFRSWLADHPREPRVAEAGEPAVLVERYGEKLVLTLNRPDSHNAFSTEIRDALCEALTVAVADASIAGVELRGRGASFCSGGDLREFGTLPDPASAHVIRSTRNAAMLLSEVGPRTGVELHGACIGAGVELAAFAAHVVAQPDAYFQLPEVSMGLVPGAGGTASLPRRIGRQRTAYMALSGERIDAPSALRWGLVDAVEG